MHKLLDSLIEMPTYVNVTMLLSIVAMLASGLMFSIRSRAKSKVDKLFIVTFSLSILTLFITIRHVNLQVEQAKSSYSIKIDQGVVEILSNSQFMKSARLTIDAENDQFLFVENENGLVYKIEKKEIKENQS